MTMTDQYIWLFRKGLDKTKEELLAYTDEETLWLIRGEIKNSSGNLAQHLVGNLKLFVGKTMGGIDYMRERDREFNERQFTREQLITLLEETATIIERSLTGKDTAFLDVPFPQEVVSIKEDQTYGFMLTYLYAHLNYHLGQINYHRRLIQK
jgi:hypothetical protein